MNFIGRQAEIARLEELNDKDGASLVTITGRRRIGKSRLVREFARQFPRFLEFSGLPPRKGVGPRQQRLEFSRQLADQCGLPLFQSNDWGELFRLLSRETARGRVVILLDEISWMGSRDALFLAKLKTAWDLYFSKNPKLILVLCGSISLWIEKNILSDTGYLGRISLQLTLEELGLPYCNQFWGGPENRISAHEKFKVLAVTGGVPRYLEEVKPQQTAEQNIARLCFHKGALLYDEFDRLFSDLFNKKAKVFRAIVLELAQGAKTYRGIAQGLERPPGGTLTAELENLVSAGFLRKSESWSLASGETLKQPRYRLSDNYSRFFLKYIAPHKPAIDRGSYPGHALTSLPGWDSVMALQFENLVLNNSARVVEALGLSPADVINEGPYLQTATLERPGAQVDLLIQARYGTLFVCEIKFTRGEIGLEVITEVSKKMNSLKVPRSTSMRPVLIHCGAVSRGVVESRFFAHVVPFEKFLTDPT